MRHDTLRGRWAAGALVAAALGTPKSPRAASATCSYPSRAPASPPRLCTWWLCAAAVASLLLLPRGGASGTAGINVVEPRPSLAASRWLLHVSSSTCPSSPAQEVGDKGSLSKGPAVPRPCPPQATMSGAAALRFAGTGHRCSHTSRQALEGQRAICWL